MDHTELAGTVEHQVEAFLSFGSYDPIFVGWPGQNLVDKCEQGTQRLLRALLQEIKERTQGVATLPPLLPIDNQQLVARKFEPMVCAFFESEERDRVLSALKPEVVFLTAENVDQVLSRVSLGTAWKLANLYLMSRSARPLGLSDSPDQNIVGLSEELTCFVSSEYFTCQEKFSDFVVHELAHVFHNSKRRTAGLPPKPHYDALLDIKYGLRENFAYACEAYSRIVEQGNERKARMALFEELETEVQDARGPADERVDEEHYLACLREACASRTPDTGWKKILRSHLHCSHASKGYRA